MSNDDKPVTVACPTCHKRVIWGEQSPFRPFCSKRCQLIDLGEWADETHRIASDEIISEDENWSEDKVIPLDRYRNTN